MMLVNGAIAAASEDGVTPSEYGLAGHFFRQMGGGMSEDQVRLDAALRSRASADLIPPGAACGCRQNRGY